MVDNDNKNQIISAAAYVRMSTDHQEYSTDNQLHAINSYAQEHGYEINRIFKDEGKSGLQTKGRDQFQALIHLVQNQKADFSALLVYDVSRWGRFQNDNEAAYYLYICEKSGIKVIFCAEPFNHQTGLLANIGSAFKRGMAAEYSRELGVKVFCGQSNLIRRGFRQGGPPGYGLRRQLTDGRGNHKGILQRGEHKSIQTDRVILIKGPPEEIDVIEFIYASFVDQALSEQVIANLLNQKGIKTDRGRNWTRGVVHQILINEKYIGHNVWNRRSFKLKEKRVKNVREDWVRADDAFEAVISKELFFQAQAIIIARSYRLSDEEMLEKLREVYQKKRYLSGIIIDEEESCPSSSAYQSRFGSLLRSYQLIGYQPDRDYRYIEINKLLRQRYPVIVELVTEKIRNLGGAIQVDNETGLLTVNDEFTAALILSRCQQTKVGNNRWIIRLDTGLSPDISIIVRMSLSGEEIVDYYLLPSSYLETPKLRLIEYQTNMIDAFRYDTLDHFYILAKRLKLKNFIL